MNKNFCFQNISKITGLKVCIYFFSTFLILSCNKDAVVNNANQDCNNQPPSALIKGEWEWISTFTLPTGLDHRSHIYTPDSVGYTMQIKFADDSEYYYKNDSLQSSSFYSLQYTHDPINKNDSTLMLYLDKSGLNGGGINVRVSCDTLILDDSYIDGPLSTYKRN